MSENNTLFSADCKSREASIPTLNYNSMFIKMFKPVMPAAFLSAMIILLSLSCASSGIEPGWNVTGKAVTARCNIRDYKEGWCDADTFRIEAAGIPADTITDPAERKMNARSNAVINARILILKRFKEMYIQDCTPEMDCGSMAAAVEVEAVIKKGIVITERWDAGQACRIIYQIHAKGLKMKVNLALYYL